MKIMKALEKLLKDYAGEYATGDEVFLVSFSASSMYMVNPSIIHNSLCKEALSTSGEWKPQLVYRSLRFNFEE
ncbi:hypothetical protein WN943_005735 [Citrus x changshan-huyou]